MLRIAVLADVAVPFGARSRPGPGRRPSTSSPRRQRAGGNTLGVGHHRPAPQRADARLVENRFFLADALLPALAVRLPRALPPGAALRGREPGDGPVKARTVLGGELVEQAPVGRQPLEQVGRGKRLLLKCRSGHGLRAQGHCGPHRSRVAEMAFAVDGKKCCHSRGGDGSPGPEPVAGDASSKRFFGVMRSGISRVQTR